jgi:serpin B
MTHPVSQNFRNGLVSNYGAVVDDVDFGSEGLRIKEEVNQWVDNQTKGNIKSLLDSAPSQDARVILLNAVYFKGKWSKQFHPHSTTPGKFLNNGKVAKDGIPFMHHNDEDFNIAHKIDFGGEKAQILEMKYLGDMSMFVILPEVPEGLDRIISGINYGHVLKSFEEMYTESVNLTLPKFKFDSKYTLNRALAKLGIKEAFEQGTADLSGVNGAKNLFLSTVVHKAVVNCDEKGTEASAATGAQMCLMCLKQSSTFRADHPFLFFIRDNKSKIILFMGIIRKF